MFSINPIADALNELKKEYDCNSLAIFLYNILINVLASVFSSLLSFLFEGLVPGLQWKIREIFMIFNVQV